ncbi:hypothetical protein TanjilG_11364 [Lupinus angustifolius]|uniref:Uncharacterized protein n=1 Tax=Lupinus angustifolius TaxID=3871 RepID=A0A1J7HS19_LUPAN|nr:hypothetical protein TanjilG_11364 [Lupinus angustifolius]
MITQILILQALPYEYETHREVELSDHKTNKIAYQPEVSSSSTNSTSSKEESHKEEVASAEGPNIRRFGKHHSRDKSVAGGGVIIGGLVTATFATVFCYIRVTRKRETVY